MTTVRPLFLLAIVLGGLLALKSLSLIDSAANMFTERAFAAPAEEPAEEDPYEEEVDEGPAPPPPPPTSASPALRAAPTASELGLERRLAERRRSLDQREAELDTREQLLTVAEQRVDDRVAELESLRDEVRELLGMMDDRRAEQINAIVAVYAQLEPDAAANILTAMAATDETTLLLVSEKLQSENPRRFAAVMAEMDAVFAAQLSYMLRLRAEPPETAVEAEARRETAEG